VRKTQNSKKDGHVATILELFSKAHRQAFHRKQVLRMWSKDAHVAHFLEYFEAAGRAEKTPSPHR
jgi:hypothetical protein